MTSIMSLDGWTLLMRVSPIFGVLLTAKRRERGAKSAGGGMGCAGSPEDEERK